MNGWGGRVEDPQKEMKLNFHNIHDLHFDKNLNNISIYRTA